MSITTVLFDLDGTLLPMDQEKFTQGYFKCLAIKLLAYGYDQEKLINGIWLGTGAMIKNDGKQTNEEAFWQTFVQVMGQKVLADKPIFEEFYRNEFQQTKDFCGYNPDGLEAVRKMKDMGYRVALATNPIFPAIATQSRIRWAGLVPEDFDLYTTYENSSFCKPNPQYYQLLADRLGVKAQECIMVGNDVLEDGAAAQVGMAVFLIKDCLINKDNQDISHIPQGDFQDFLRFMADLREAYN